MHVNEIEAKARRFADYAFYKRLQDPIPNDLRATLQFLLSRLTTYDAPHSKMFAVSKTTRETVAKYAIPEALQLANFLEALPIDEGGNGADQIEPVDSKNPMYFALLRGKWVPCFSGRETRGGGYAILGIRYKNGDTETLTVRPGFWAFATADNKPSMPWIWD